MVSSQSLNWGALEAALEVLAECPPIPSLKIEVLRLAHARSQNEVLGDSRAIRWLGRILWGLYDY